MLVAKFEFINSELQINSECITTYTNRIAFAVATMKQRSTCREKLIVSLTNIYEMVMRDFRKAFAGFEKFVNWKRMEDIAARLVLVEV